MSHDSRIGSSLSSCLIWPQAAGRCLLCAVTLWSGLAQAQAQALDQTTGSSLATIEVVGETLLEGMSLPLSQMPSNAQKILAVDIRAQNPSNLAEILDAQIGAVTLSNGSGNPYQNDVNYRGFQATSLLGAPVSLSVYFEGVRMNEPFGATVNWDLIPMNAVSSLTLLPGSNPMFGLNTLGGAMVVQTKNGRNDSGSRFNWIVGSYARRALQMETGWVNEAKGTDYFLASNWDRQDGYRDHSGSTVKQVFVKTRWHSQGTRLEASVALAESRLSGTQSLPMDTLDQPRSAYTWPDTRHHQSGLMSLKARHPLGDSHEIAAQVYFRHSTSKSVNSNAELDGSCFNDDGALASSIDPGGLSTIKCANKAPFGIATNGVSSAAALALGYGRWTHAINTSLVESSTRQQTWGTSLQWSNFDKWLGLDNSFAMGASASQSRISFAQDSLLARLVNYQAVISPNAHYGYTSSGQAPNLDEPPVFTGPTTLRDVRLSATATDASLFFINTLDLTAKLKGTVAGSFNFSTVRQVGRSQRHLNDDAGLSWNSDAFTTYYNPAVVGAYSDTNLVSPVDLPAGAVPGPEVKRLDGAHRFQRLNPALSFYHQWRPSYSFFGGYSEAMRAPTSVELSCANPQSPCALPTGFNGDPDLKAVVARTFEFGARGKAGAALTWSAAVYRARLSDDIQFIAAPNSTTFGYFANVGATERRGWEIGAQTRLGKLFLSANLGHVRPTYQSGFTTQGGQEVVSGNTLPGIPSTSVKVRASVPLGADWQLGGQWVAVSGQYAHGNESNRDPQGKIPGHRLAHLDLSHQFSPAVKFTAHVSNLLDKRYSTYGLSRVTSVYSLREQTFFTPASTRTVWLGVSYSLGGKASDK